MEFDPDRLAKLAGISGADAATTTTAPHKPASAPGGLIRESAASSRRAPESKEVKQLRQLIRAEAAQMIREMRSQRAGSRLSESVAMGFYGPGFAGSPLPVLGGPMSSSGRVASIEEGWGDKAKDFLYGVAPGIQEALTKYANLSREVFKGGGYPDYIKKILASGDPDSQLAGATGTDKNMLTALVINNFDKNLQEFGISPEFFNTNFAKSVEAKYRNIFEQNKIEALQKIEKFLGSKDGEIYNLNKSKPDASAARIAFVKTVGKSINLD